MKTPRKPKPINTKDLRIKLAATGEDVFIETRDVEYWNEVFINKKDLIKVALQLVGWALWFDSKGIRDD